MTESPETLHGPSDPDASGPGARYDDYWRQRDVERARARSVTRAHLALRLLRSGTLDRDRRGPCGGARLLEIGCGPGWALETFRAAGYHVRGIDVSPRAAEAARRRGLEVDVLDLEQDSPRGAYDVVAALEVLEHLTTPLRALERMKTVLAPEGRLVVSLPNEFHLGRRLAILCGVPRFGGHDDPHLRHFDERLARRLFRAASLSVLARLSDSVAPPRWRIFRWLSLPLVRLLPGLFALSHVFLLAPLREGD